MSFYLGDFPTSHTAVCIPFDSFSATTGAPSATTNFAAGDIQIYKDGGTTQRSSSAGITVSTSFDSNTGLQLIVIDLSDNTDAGFYAAGHEYQVAVADITVDSQTLRFWAGTFSIERANGVLALLKATGSVKVDVVKWNSTAVATPATAGIPDVNAKNINNVAAATPGASGGVLISGSNSGTTTLAALTVTGATTLTGNMVLSDGLTVSAPSTGNRAGITVTGNGTGAGVSITSGNGATGNGVDAIAASTNGHGVSTLGNGTGSGLKLASVSGDALLTAVSTSGHGATFAGTGTTKHGLNATGGATTSHGISATGGGVGHGILATSGGGATGDGIKAVAVSTNSNGLNLVGAGTGNGLLTTGGAGAGGDGVDAVAGGGVDIRGAITGNVTGAVSGSVGSVTGAVGSVTGNVGGNVVGSVASVTAAVSITTNAKKNQALAKFAFLMTDSTNHNPATGLTVTCTRSIDGAAFGAGTLANVAELANGIYLVDFGAGDLNGNVITLRATAAASDDAFERIVTFI